MLTRLRPWLAPLLLLGAAAYALAEETPTSLDAPCTLA